MGTPGQIRQGGLGLTAVHFPTASFVAGADSGAGLKKGCPALGRGSKLIGCNRGASTDIETLNLEQFRGNTSLGDLLRSRCVRLTLGSRVNNVEELIAQNA